MVERQKRSPIVVAWGELVWDLYPDGERLGGCAANTAYHLAQLGATTRLVTRVGTDTLGQRAVTQLAAVGVLTDLVQRDRVRHTGTVKVEIIGGEPRFTLATEAAWNSIAWNDALQQAVAEADVLHFGALAQHTPLGSGALREAWRATRADCLRICDLNLRAPVPPASTVRATLLAADVVKLNERELTLLGRLFNESDPVSWLLEALGVRLVALTRGDRGCVLTRLNARVEHPGFPIAHPSGDPVGAGDAFTAVLCDSLARGVGLGPAHELHEVAARCNRVAAYVASCRGATPSLPLSVL